MASIVVSYLKYNIPETGLCLRLQMEPTQLDSIDIPQRGTGSTDWAQLSTYNLIMEIVQSPKRCVSE
jgi:hypothetical protein